MPYNGEDNNDYVDGEVVQHIEYVPFGEVFVEERNNIWNTPYLFNAKEFDEETGLYYYGARYYDPRLGLWITTDPLQEKYYDISTYCYAYNNPICRSNGDITIRLSYDEDNYEYYNVVSYIDLINKRKNKSVNYQKVYNDL